MRDVAGEASPTPIEHWGALMRRTRPSWSRAVLRLRPLCLSAGFVWGLTSALASSASPSPSNGKVILRLGWLAGPDNLNPFIGTTSSAFTVWYMNYDTLVGLNTTDVTPNKTTGLATGWTHERRTARPGPSRSARTPSGRTASR